MARTLKEYRAELLPRLAQSVDVEVVDDPPCWTVRDPSGEVYFEIGVIGDVESGGWVLTASSLDLAVETDAEDPWLARFLQELGRSPLAFYVAHAGRNVLAWHIANGFGRPSRLLRSLAHFPGVALSLYTISEVRTKRLKAILEPD